MQEFNSSVKVDRRIDVLRSYFELHDLLQHQKEAYNSLVGRGAQSVLELLSPISLGTGDRYKLHLGNISFSSPTHEEIDEELTQVTPAMCMWRSLTYASNIHMEVTLVDTETGKQSPQTVSPGKIPVMVRSDLCTLKRTRCVNDPVLLASIFEDIEDPGGYFIMNRVRKFVVPRERPVYNHVYTYVNRKTSPKFPLYSEVRSSVRMGTHSTATIVGWHQERLWCVLPWMDGISIPFGVLMKALGVIEEEEILRITLGVKWSDDKCCDYLLPTLEMSTHITSSKKAIRFIESKLNNKKTKTLTAQHDDGTEQKMYVSSLLRKELLCHVGETEEHDLEKAHYLAWMTRKLMLTQLGIDLSRSGGLGENNSQDKLTWLPLDDRDHFMKKRLWTVDALLRYQFYLGMRAQLKEVTIMSKKRPFDIDINLNPWFRGKRESSHVTDFFVRALVRDQWGGNRKSLGGATHKLDRYNHISVFDAQRKISPPINKKGGKISEARKIHSSQKGYICAAATPGKKKCGLIKQLALSTRITSSNDDESGECMTKIIEDMFLPLATAIRDSSVDVANCIKVMINGLWVGIVEDGSKSSKLISRVRKLRRSAISFETSVSFNSIERQVRIYTDGGRVTRPLLVVNDGKIADLEPYFSSGQVPLFTTLVHDGVVEMIDVEEAESCLIASTPEEVTSKHTHCEVHPSMLFGACASITPFIGHNNGTKNTYQADMTKQSVGVPSTNFAFETDSKVCVLNCVQKPLCVPRVMEFTRYNNMPTGQNLMTAVMAYKTNQEDAVDVSKSSLHYGAMGISEFTPFSRSCQTDRGERFEIPDKQMCGYLVGDTSKLAEDGVVEPGCQVVKGDTLIGLTKSGEGGKRTDRSVVYNFILPGVVSQVQYGIDGGGYKYYTVVVCVQRSLMEGDKVASRPGQKGVNSSTHKREDLPFDERGITPDILLNPIAFAGRMTIGIFLEIMFNLAVCHRNILHHITFEQLLTDSDCTAFQKVDSEKIEKLLTKLGVPGGKRIMTCGTTGTELRAWVFFGPTYYHRLEHMVLNKIQVRSTGSKPAYFRQPKHSKADHGGLKFGFMERDMLLAQGLPWSVKDRMMDQSDNYSMWVCSLCGLPALKVKEDASRRANMIKRMKCAVCGTEECTKIYIPYATKLIVQELMSTNIICRMIPEGSRALKWTPRPMTNNDWDKMVRARHQKPTPLILIDED